MLERLREAEDEWWPLLMNPWLVLSVMGVVVFFFHRMVEALEDQLFDLREQLSATQSKLSELESRLDDAFPDA